jgi:RNA polymerase sigma factor (sigma-70 family)
LEYFALLIRLYKEKEMDEALRRPWPMAPEDQQISKAVDHDYAGLRKFIRRRVADPADAEDILQDVFFELVEAYRLMKPVEQVTAWLFRVARNRIIDLFRRRQRDAARTGLSAAPTDEDSLELEELLPSPEAGPEAAYFRIALAEELDDALDELPDEQREVFVANELMGYTFQEIAKQTGVSVNTLLSRKRYAVQHLRKRLQTIYDEFIGSSGR